MDVGLYESKDEAEKREEVLQRIRQVIGLYFFNGKLDLCVKIVNCGLVRLNNFLLIRTKSF